MPRIPSLVSDKVLDTFFTVFGRRTSTQELVILRRLRKTYSEELVAEAIRLSSAITDGSPIRYIIVVANNLFKKSAQETTSLIEVTLEKLKELEKYGPSTR